MEKHIHPEELSHLPESGRILFALIGSEAANKLIEALGGTTLPIAQGKTRMGEIRFAALAEVVGEDNARTLATHYQSEKLYIPRCTSWLIRKRNTNILSDFDRLTGKEGYSYPETIISLSLKYRLSDRQIEKILKLSTDK